MRAANQLAAGKQVVHLFELSLSLLAPPTTAGRVGSGWVGSGRVGWARNNCGRVRLMGCTIAGTAHHPSMHHDEPCVAPHPSLERMSKIAKNPSTRIPKE